MSYVMVAGDLMHGIESIYGPFPDHDTALAYGRAHAKEENWNAWYAYPLEAPEAGPSHAVDEDWNVADHDPLAPTKAVSEGRK
jgi:hypothetical protein